MNRFRFTKVRDVKSPSRANIGDAGLDFYVPVNLTPDDLIKANEKATENDPASTSFYFRTNDKGLIEEIMIPGNHRIVIPSGIKGLIEPIDSALIAANKSGVATKKGLIYTAEVVDSPYTGEIHIAVVNTSFVDKVILAGEKLSQFLHVPLYLTNPEEISNEEYDYLSEDWGTRGSDWQGSSDNK